MRLQVAYMEANWLGLVRTSCTLAFGSKMVFCTIFSSVIVTCQVISQEAHWRMRHRASLIQTVVSGISFQPTKLF